MFKFVVVFAFTLLFDGVSAGGLLKTVLDKRPEFGTPTIRETLHPGSVPKPPPTKPPTSKPPTFKPPTFKPPTFKPNPKPPTVPVPPVFKPPGKNYYYPDPVYTPKPVYSKFTKYLGKDSKKKPSMFFVDDDLDCTTVAAAAAATPELSILVQALTVANLVEPLSDPEFVATILAPTDDAFAAVAETLGVELEDVLSDPQLANILLYHVIPEVAVFAADLEDKAEITAAVGQDLTVDLDDGVTFVGFGSSANVVVPDVKACKAVIHVIDAVLLPDFSTLIAEAATTEESDDAEDLVLNLN